MNNASAEILEAEQLKKLTGYEKDGDLKRHLQGLGIPCFVSRGRVWTTLYLVNLAGMRQLGIEGTGEEKKEWL